MINTGRPDHNAQLLEELCRTEFEYWADSSQKFRERNCPRTPKPPPRSAGVPGCFRLPAPGEPVAISGVRRRPELNGARGVVLGRRPDDSGRVAVRLGEGGTVLVPPDRLVPLQAAPSAELVFLPPEHDDDRSSVRSCSLASLSLASLRGGGGAPVAAVPSGSGASVASRRSAATSAAASRLSGSHAGALPQPRRVASASVLERLGS
eukprot:TRINITY_DN38003_c0_g1_i1.p1 TRINITY_DN38003_c0_g1~~TRINITY_DN38003_c0_g1_i1.p1  ORF type:complete len:224 (-),score=35.41 TRINITY_DN38003_c0_g1_i1:54-674(-)